MHLSAESHLVRSPSLHVVRVLSLRQTLYAHPGLARADAPPGLLASAEQTQLASLRVEKRRRDWLLGRWTAKHLLLDCLQQETGRLFPLDGLLIGQDPDGAPYAAIVGPPSERLPLSISISHSGDRAFCALADEPGVSIGADIEMVRPGLDEMARQFFASEELAWLEHIAPDERAAAIVTVWSAKEAVLKALRMGLRADTRRVVCVPERIAGDEWAAVAVRCDDLLANEPIGEVAAWCRRSGDYVESLALRGK